MDVMYNFKMKKLLYLTTLSILIILILFIVSSCSLIFPRVEGLVIDAQSGQAIDNAQVKIARSKIFALTNKRGVFILYVYSLKKPEYVDITVFKNGYNMKVVRVYLDKKGVGNIIIELTKATSI